MNLNKENETVYCHQCKKDICLHTEVYMPDNDILCLNCNAHLGYTWDLCGVFWTEEDLKDELPLRKTISGQPE